MIEQIKQLLIVLFSAAVGGSLVWVLQGHSLAILPSAMSYADFVAILLTGLAALVAAIALVITIFALWGWSQFRKGVEQKITEVTPVFLTQQLQNGPTRRLLEELVADFMSKVKDNPGLAEAWTAERGRAQEELKKLDDEPEE